MKLSIDLNTRQFIGLRAALANEMARMGNEGDHDMEQALAMMLDDIAAQAPQAYLDEEAEYHA